MFLEPPGESGFGTNLPPILLEEEIHQDEGNAFIAIDKRVVLADMIPIGRGFVEERRVGKLASDRDFGLSKCGIKQVRITETWPSTVPL